MVLNITRTFYICIMNYQTILVYISLSIAVFFLVRKFFWKQKSKKNCGDDDCGCH